jgi:hypothetical protein
VENAFSDLEISALKSPTRLDSCRVGRKGGLKVAGHRVGQEVRIGDGDLFGCFVMTRGADPLTKRVVVWEIPEEANIRSLHGYAWNFD